VNSLADLQPTLERIGQQFGAVTATVHVLGADGLLHLIASFGVPEQLKPVIGSIPIGKGIAGVAAQRREPVTICNIQTDDSGVARPGAKSMGVEGAIAVPILDGDTLVGVLGIGKAQAHTYSADEVNSLLQWAASLCALQTRP
jgi:L-methionine (R)-S-oxide reductase